MKNVSLCAILRCKEWWLGFVEFSCLSWFSFADSTSRFLCQPLILHLQRIQHWWNVNGWMNVLQRKQSNEAMKYKKHNLDFWGLSLPLLALLFPQFLWPDIATCKSLRSFDCHKVTVVHIYSIIGRGLVNLVSGSCCVLYLVQSDIQCSEPHAQAAGSTSVSKEFRCSVWCNWARHFAFFVLTHRVDDYNYVDALTDAVHFWKYFFIMQTLR